MAQGLRLLLEVDLLRPILDKTSSNAIANLDTRNVSQGAQVARHAREFVQMTLDSDRISTKTTILQGESSF
jgi:hypothetical protein